jgi:outer membrane receptor for ferrienterochelin and colicin
MSAKNYFYKILFLSAVIVVFIILQSITLSAQEKIKAEESFKMSLKELMDIEIDVGTLTGRKLSKVPAAITIITREDIEKTPARNILDLMEVYVPGLMIFNGSNGGPNIKIRGLGHRNYKTLLLVNGRPVNQKAFLGSVVEINNWDLNDIERIEVIRGPGSVTYGLGAIAGIINIITIRAGSLDGVKTGLEYNEGYDSKGAFLQYGFDKEKFKLFTHISIRDTNGDDNQKGFQALSNGQIGYKGDPNTFPSSSDGYPIMNYYKDSDNNPQIKAHLDLTYLENWRFWLRYTNSGTVKYNANKIQYQGSNEWEDGYRYKDRSFIASLENTHEFSNTINLKSVLSFDSEDYKLLAKRNPSLSSSDVLQRSYSFSENEVFARSILNYKFSENLKAALGLEYSHDWLGDNWGESDTFRGWAGGSFISKDSPYSQVIAANNVMEYNSGWDVNTYSLMGEIDYAFTPQFEALLSGRVDKNDYTDTMFSPRIAFVSELSDKDMVKAIWQKSLSMNTMMELYSLDLQGKDADPEELTIYQLIYSRLQNENLSFQLSAYYNKVEIMSWSGTNSEIVGEMGTYGAELEAKYKTDDDKWLFGMNHSYFHLDNWDYFLKTTDGTSRQNVSYSDFYYIKDNLTFNSTGNSINYWADNITKLFARTKFLEDWTLHMDSRIVWEHNYGKDYMEMYRNAYNNVDTSLLSVADLATYNTNKAFLSEYERILKAKNAFGLSWNFNASLSWDIPYFKKNKTTLILYGQNIFDYGDNKRYADQIYVGDLPIFSWVEEPRTFGVKLTAEF